MVTDITLGLIGLIGVSSDIVVGGEDRIKQNIV